MQTIIIAYALFICDLLIREGLMRKGKNAKKLSGSKYDKGTTLLAVFIIIVGAVLPFFLKYLDFGSLGYNITVSWFGILLMLIGIIIQIIAEKTLGKFYSRTLIIQEDHKIVEEGLYGKIRHPGYFGGLITWLGYALALGNWIAFLIIMSLFILYCFYRIPNEEAMLINKFGRKYKDYKKKTWTIIPFIY